MQRQYLLSPNNSNSEVEADPFQAHFCTLSQYLDMMVNGHEDIYIYMHALSQETVMALTTQLILFRTAASAPLLRQAINQ